MESWKEWLCSFISESCAIAIVYWHYRTGSIYAENIICFWYWFVSIFAILFVFCKQKKKQRSTSYKSFVLLSCSIPIVYMVAVGWTLTASVSAFGLICHFYMMSKKSKNTNDTKIKQERL